MLSMKQEVSLAERTYILQYIQEERFRLYFSRKNSSFENLYWIARMKFIVHTVYKNRKISKLNALLFDRRTLWFRCFSRKPPGRQGFFTLLFAVASRNKNLPQEKSSKNEKCFLKNNPLVGFLFTLHMLSYPK